MLRKVLIMSLLLTGVVFWSCSEKGSESSDGNSMPTEEGGKPLSPTTMEFKDSVYDFGEGVKGNHVVHTFEFTNTGKNDLVIADAKAGCGCTVPEWPKEPIKPGATGVIKVDYNGSGSGRVNKTVTVTANTTPPTRVLTITGYIKEEVKGPFIKQESH